MKKVALGITNDIVEMICPRLGNGRCLQFYCVVGFLTIVSPCSDPDAEGHAPISFHKKLFCACVIRHSRNPVCNEKLLFRVQSYETATKFQVTVLDWGKLAPNDYIADASSDVKELLDSTIMRRDCMRLARMGPMKVFKVAMSTAKEMLWEAKHNFVVTFRWVAFMSVSVCPFAN